MWSVDIDAVTCVHNLQYRFSTCEHWNQLPDSFRQPRLTPVIIIIITWRKRKQASKASVSEK